MFVFKTACVACSWGFGSPLLIKLYNASWITEAEAPVSISSDTGFVFIQSSTTCRHILFVQVNSRYSSSWLPS